MQPKKWNSPICTNLKITLIKRNFIRSIDASETIPNLNSAVNESGGTNKVAYSSIRCVFVDAVVAEIVVYKKWPRSMRLDFLGNQTLFWLPTLFWIKDKEPDSANHFRQVVNNFHKSVRAWWVFSFSMTKHFFGHQIVNFVPCRLMFAGSLYLNHSRG